MKAYRAIIGKLITRTAIHVGTGVGGDVTDDLCRRNAEGRFLIPGTAIGGALRAIATRLAPRLQGGESCKGLRKDDDGRPCGCAVCHLFGEINPAEGDTEETGGRASRLLISHAWASILHAKPIQIRDGVGIERASRTAAAAGRVKFDLEVLPADTEFQLRLELDDDGDQDKQLSAQDERLLAAVLAEWKAGRAWLGGCVARGLGAFDLRDIKLVRRKLKEVADVLAFLRTDWPWEITPGGLDTSATEDVNWLTTRLSEVQLADKVESGEGVAHSFVTISFDLQFDSLFLTSDITAAAYSSFDQASLLDVMAKEGRLILPGASLRGVLRTQAERIARTLATLEAAEVSDKDQRLRKFRTICPACNPLEARTGEETDEKFPLNSCDALLKKAGVKGDDEVRDEQLCLACRLFGSTRRGSRFIVEDAMETRDFEDSSKVLDFLAIDRFTGGGKDGAKFDAIASWQPTFAVRLHLENPEGWELGWLALVLRDLQEGMLTIGFGAAKGFGQAKIESYRLDYGFISESDLCGPAELTRAQAASCHSLYRTLVWDTRSAEQQIGLRKLEQYWLEQFHVERKQFARVSLEQARAESRLPMLEADTFFGTEAEELYGKARIL